MARLPSSILKQELARAVDKASKIESHKDSVNYSVLMKAHEDTGNYYLMYKDVIRSFLLEGYSEEKAEKYLKHWYDYDIISVEWVEGYKLVGFPAVI